MIEPTLVYWLMFLGLIFIVGVQIAYLNKLSKFVDEVKDADIPSTNIHKAWIWAQLIPFVGAFIQIVFNLKMNSAVKDLEEKRYLPEGHIEYPYIVGWILPIVHLSLNAIKPYGALLYLIFFILYWVRIDAGIKQVKALKANNFGLNNEEDAQK